MTCDDVIAQVRSTDKLPSLPGVAVKILRVTNDPNAGLDDLAQVIIEDPALVARLLKVVNSPLFGVARQVTSISKATALLGMRSVKSLALSFSLVDLIRKNSDDDFKFDFEGYWRRSLTTAVAGRKIAELVAPAEKEEAFVAGLLSDIGIMALILAVPEWGESIGRQWTETGCWDVAFEEEQFGVTHAAVGESLLDMWSLPDTLRTAVGHHHDDIAAMQASGDEQFTPLIRLVRAATEIAGLFCGDIDIATMDPCIDRCTQLTGIDTASLDMVLDDLANHVQNTALLLSVPIGQWIDYSAIQKEAEKRLAGADDDNADSADGGSSSQAA
ncbi:MAG: HDOD domain-containing protein [Planctomycetes bacterium]|nr:HDOD domain-containing protein [Planctomycetota bacterium]